MPNGNFTLYRQTPSSTIPSRISASNEQLPQFQYGELKFSFHYNGTDYAFEVPFTRPYTNKELGIFANLLNLNPQRRQLFNQGFRDFETTNTVDFFGHFPDGIPCNFEVIFEGQR